MVTSTKTTISKGTDVWFDSRSGGIRNGDGILTKSEKEGYLGNCPASFGIEKTHLEQRQRDHRSST